MGILYALSALIAWGVGDFLIQKTSRAIGIWKSLFFIGVVSFLGLLPFVKNDISELSQNSILLLVLLGIVVIFASLFNFESLREGKIAIVEPILGLELPITVGLSVLIAQDQISFLQALLIIFVFIGIALAATTDKNHFKSHHRLFEKGVILALVGAVGMALTNVLVGISSQEISPLVTIWFAHSLLGFVCMIRLMMNRTFFSIFSDVKKYPALILGESIFDNIAWISFGLATTLIPISIVTTISESYIVLAVLLGFFLNKEKIQTHQGIGIAMSIIGVVILSAI